MANLRCRTSCLRGWSIASVNRSKRVERAFAMAIARVKRECLFFSFSLLQLFLVPTCLFSVSHSTFRARFIDFLLRSTLFFVFLGIHNAFIFLSFYNMRDFVKNCYIQLASSLLMIKFYSTGSIILEKEGLFLRRSQKANKDKLSNMTENSE